MWKSLSCHSALRDGVGEREARHRLVCELRVEAHHLGPLELVDEREGVPDRRQQDVAARLVRLGFEREPQVVPALTYMRAAQVDRLGVSVEGRAERPSRPRPRPPHARPTSRTRRRPARRRGRWRRKVFGTAKRRTPGSLAVNAPSLKTGRLKRLVVAIGTFMPVSSSARAEALQDRLAFGCARPRGHQVVVVEVDAVRTELGQAMHGLDRVERRSHLVRRTGRVPCCRPSTARR